MRNGQNNKRMRNRNQGGNRNDGRRGQNPMTRVFESNGPDIKIRGTASHVAEKYVQLARDARSSGDPVAAENYYQHAEHYFRLIAAAQEQFRQNQPQPRIDADTSAAEEGDDESEGFSHFGQEPGVPAVGLDPVPGGAQQLRGCGHHAVDAGLPKVPGQHVPGGPGLVHGLDRRGEPPHPLQHHRRIGGHGRPHDFPGLRVQRAPGDDRAYQVLANRLKSIVRKQLPNVELSGAVR